MTRQAIRLDIPNPDDGNASWTLVRIERASLLGGSVPPAPDPATWAQILSIPLDPASEVTRCFDEAGIVTDFYRYRYDNPVGVPPAAPVLVAGVDAVDGPNGTYRCSVTFVSPQGESVGGTEAVLAVVGKKIEWSGIPLGPVNTVTRRLYRTVAGGVAGTARRIGEIADNTTSVFSDGVPDKAIVNAALVPGAGPNASPYSTPIQTNDFLVRQWIKNDIPDADILDPDWKQWELNALLLLWSPYQIWIPGVRQTLDLAASSASDSSIAASEYAPLDESIVEADRVEKLDRDGRHLAWLYGSEWEQEGREVRLYDADPSSRYVVHGRGRFRWVGQLTEIHFMLFYYLVRRRYIEFRLNQRINFLEWVTFGNRRNSTSPDTLRALLAEVKVDIAQQAAVLGENIPGQELATGGPD